MITFPLKRGHLYHKSHDCHMTNQCLCSQATSEGSFRWHHTEEGPLCSKKRVQAVLSVKCFQNILSYTGTKRKVKSWKKQEIEPSTPVLCR